MKPELFDDKDIDNLVDKVYNKCIDKDCTTCPYYSELDEEVCKADVIFELWRKWKNTKEII